VRSWLGAGEFAVVGRSVVARYRERLTRCRASLTDGVLAVTARYRPILPIASGMVAVLAIAEATHRLLQHGTFGCDAFAYWRLPHFDNSLYGGVSDANGLGVFRYAPAFAQLVRPLWGLDWPAFDFVWSALIIGTMIWCLGWRASLLGLGFITWVGELPAGNVHVFMAAAITLGFRYPAAWSFMLLTKVTPGVGLVWFLVRREWRALAIALGATAAITGASVISGAWDPLGGLDTWTAWVRSLVGTRTVHLPNALLVDAPVVIRTLAAAVLVAWGARTDRRWTVFAGAVLALPTIWVNGLTILLGIPALRWMRDPVPWTVTGLLGRVRRSVSPRSAGGSEAPTIPSAQDGRSPEA
jgi:hypothetical protein